jgi:hypothetical protein
MRIASATEPGSPTSSNEDWLFANHGLIVVLDGATARTNTGCVHGVSWFADKLGMTIAGLASDRDILLGDVLTSAIAHTASLHPECDLSHPATPSATTAIARVNQGVLEYLVLGDTTIIVETTNGLQVLIDDRVDSTAKVERAEANRYPFGSAEKQAALLKMKHAELAQRNQPGGFWVAAADPGVAVHSIRGELPLEDVRSVAVLTDGAARIVAMFGLLTWHGVLEVLDSKGPTELIKRVRLIEEADPTGTKWPRNKPSDDATAVYAH